MFNYQKILPAFGPGDTKDANIELIEVINKGPLVNWVIDVDCLTEPGPRWGRGPGSKQSSKIPLTGIEKFVTESVGRGCQEQLGALKGPCRSNISVPALHV